MFALYVKRLKEDKARWVTEDMDENYMCEVVGREYIESMRYERVCVAHRVVGRKPQIVMEWSRTLWED